MTPETSPPAPLGLLLCDDLLLGSKVTGTAKALGRSVRTCRNQAGVLSALAGDPVACIFVDLHNATLDPVALVEAAKTSAGKPRVVGFGSHGDVATLSRARDAGFDAVLPRSRFFEELATLMPEWMG